MTSIHEAFGQRRAAGADQRAGGDGRGTSSSSAAGTTGSPRAAYLAQAGKSVLVLERRERLGGACTLEEPFRDPATPSARAPTSSGCSTSGSSTSWRCAGTATTSILAEPAIWCPFDDGTWYAQFLDHERTVAACARTASPRPTSRASSSTRSSSTACAGRSARAARDTWVGDSPPTRRAGRAARPRPRAGRGAVRDVDRRRHRPLRQRPAAAAGALRPGRHRRRGPGRSTPGTASIKLMHFQGTLEGVPMAWGYVEGGMGRISFAIARGGERGRRRARRRRARRRDPAGRGRRAGGRRADPRPGRRLQRRPEVTGRLLGDAADPAFAARLDGWRTASPVVKVNCGLSPAAALDRGP